MWVRIASAAVGIPLAIAIVFAREPIVLTVTVALLSVIGVHEFYRGVRKTGCEPVEWLGWMACIIFAADAGLSNNPDVLTRSSVPIAALIILGLVTELFRRRRSPIRNIGATLLGALYAGWLLSFVAGLRNHGVMLLGWEPGTPEDLQPSWLSFQDPGARLVMFALIGVWSCDIGAYFTGRFLGRHKLAPAISPGKTIEGFVGGVALSVVVVLFLGGWIGLRLPDRVIIGLIIGLFCVIGDLTESAMKREIGVKDFGAIMPGHGGVLDRFDSLLFVAPVLFYVLFLHQQLLSLL